MNTYIIMNTYDDILAAIMRAQFIWQLRDLDKVIVDTFTASEINDNQVALLRRSITAREDAIAQLATL
jgi:hypothetical protein